VTIGPATAIIKVQRDLDADDAFPLRATLAELTEAGCTDLVYDVADIFYIAHSAQTVIRDDCKRREVILLDVTDRLRRTLTKDRVQLLTVVTEQTS
jgi:hypothetical protein